MSQDDWTGCYDGGWKGLCVEEAFAHPAKFSRALIARMFQHAKDEGWIVPGSTILDPFGGVGLGALPAMQAGCHWLGVELEEKFVFLGNKNIALWKQRFSSLPGWGTAVLLQGDSRRLSAIVREQADLVCGSPPFSDQLAQQDRAFRMPHDTTGNINADYGTTEGQLGAMTPGDFSLVASSPPYENQSQGRGATDKRNFTYMGKANYTGNRCSVNRYSGERTATNLEEDSGTTFWSAARQIVSESYLLLKPGAVSMWVVKGFIRKGKLVDFPGQWQQLCESVGFQLLHEHHAMLTTELDEQFHLDGSSQRRRVERKSFFRRLAEKKGSPKIDYETILCLRKPYLPIEPRSFDVRGIGHANTEGQGEPFTAEK